MKTFGRPLADALAEGLVPEALVDRAVRRVLVQKAQLGLLDAEWSPVPPVLAATEDADPEALRGTVRLDTEENRALARRVAEEAVVLLRNDGTLPLAADPPAGAPARIALVGPNADTPTAVLGCYSFPVHVGGRHPGPRSASPCPPCARPWRRSSRTARSSPRRVPPSTDGTPTASARPSPWPKAPTS